MYSARISSELNIAAWQADKVIKLFDDGATVPFIARYRKEMTGSLDEEVITQVRDRLHQLKDLDKRREAILASLMQQGVLTKELEQQVNQASVMAELEDIYLPYRPKRKTRATIAKSKGLEPLARMIMAQNPMDVNQKAMLFINKAKDVNTIEEALSGARDIIAEWVSESAAARARIRNFFLREGIITSKVAKEKEEEGNKYQT